jgi:3-oxoacyl-[acyl-carrier protein] reductase
MAEQALKLPQQAYSIKSAIVAGYGTIGSCIVQELVNDGYKVVTITRSGGKGKSINGVTHMKADLYDFKQTIAVVNEAEKQLGGFTLAICCAGEIPYPMALSSSHQDDSSDKPLCGIELNFCRATAPKLRLRKEGALVFFTSSLSLNCADTPGLAGFLAWANGVTGMCDGLPAELRMAGVRVTLLLLGLVKGSKFSRETMELMGKKAFNPVLSSNDDKWVLPLDIARSVKFVTEPSVLNGNIWEMELNPQPMLDKNAIFTDQPRVEEMLSKLNEPAFRDNKVALVTGSGKGIGKGVVLELCRAGFHIAAMTRTAKDLEALAQECKQINPKCDVLSLPLDVTNDQALSEGVRKTIEHFGTVTVVVSNAGTNRRRVAPLADIKTWKDIMDVDLIAAMNLTRLTLPYLIRHAKLSKLDQKPLLAFVSTRYAHHKGSRMPGISPYICAKTGTNAFAKVVLEEVRDYGVGVLSLSPGTVATDLGMKPNAAAKDGKLIDPRYLLQPADCGKSIVFAANTVSKSCCINNIWLESLYHPYPVIRKIQGNFIASNL